MCSSDLIRSFVMHPKTYQDENGHADGKRYYIEDGIKGIADQVTPGDKEIVFEHIGCCFGIEQKDSHQHAGLLTGY